MASKRAQVQQTTLSRSPFEEFCSTLCDDPNHNWYGVLAKLARKQLGKKELTGLPLADQVRLVSSLAPADLLRLLYRYGFAGDRQGFIALDDYKNLDVRRLQFVYEFLQNSEDARATLCRFEISPDAITVFNDGVCFDARNLYAICSFNESDKQVRDEKQIGKFGVGFKSVFRLTSRPIVYTFDQDSGTRIAFRFFEPGAIDRAYYDGVLAEAPLDYSPKIPRQSRENFYLDVGYILPECIQWPPGEQLSQGHAHGSIFTLPLRNTLQPGEVSDNLKQAISSEVFLFLRLSTIEIADTARGKKSVRTLVKKSRPLKVSAPGELARVDVKAGSELDSFLVYSQKCQLTIEDRERFTDLSEWERRRLPEQFLIQIACPIDEEGALSFLTEPSGKLFSFLPIPDLVTRLNCHINAPFNLTKSRANLVEDDFNQWLIQMVAAAYLSLLSGLRQEQRYRRYLYRLLPAPPSQTSTSDRLSPLYAALDRYAMEEGYIPVHGSDELCPPGKAIFPSAKVASEAITFLLLELGCLHERRLVSERDAYLIQLNKHYGVEELHIDDVWEFLGQDTARLTELLRSQDQALQALIELFEQSNNPPQPMKELLILESPADRKPRRLLHALFGSPEIPAELDSTVCQALPEYNWVTRECAYRLVSRCSRERGRERLQQAGLLPTPVTIANLADLCFKAVEMQKEVSPGLIRLFEFLIEKHPALLTEQRRLDLGRLLKVKLKDHDGDLRSVRVADTFRPSKVSELPALGPYPASLGHLLGQIYAEVPGLATLVEIFGGVLGSSTFLEILADRVGKDSRSLCWFVRYLASLKRQPGLKWKDLGYGAVLVPLRLPAIGSEDWISADLLFSEGFGKDTLHNEAVDLAEVLGPRCIDWQALPSDFPKSELNGLLQSHQGSAVFLPQLEQLESCLLALEQESGPEIRSRKALALAGYLARVADLMERTGGQSFKAEAKKLLSHGAWLSGNGGDATCPSAMIEPEFWKLLGPNADVPGAPYPSVHLDALARALEKLQKAGWLNFSARGRAMVSMRFGKCQGV